MKIAKNVCASVALAAIMVAGASGSWAASCSKTAAGFDEWKGEIRGEAISAGVSQGTVDKVLASVSYSKATIRADRGQKSFKLSLNEFLRKRGAQTIVSRGKKLKAQNARLFAALEQRYGVPAGPLIAIWGMETGFGSFMGKEHTLSAVATLSFDCRRSAYFTDQFFAAMKLVDAGNLKINARGAAHGEIGQTQFLPKNVLKFGVDGDGNGHIDMVGSKSDAMASTANFLRGHGWSAGGGYQPGQANYGAIQGWNAASVYQQAIALMGAQIDGETQ
jgi:lytic murein transglycosylase